jgi:ribonuclease HI
LGAAIAKETVLLISYKCLPFRLMSIKGSIYKVKNYIIYDIYNMFTSLNNIGINVILEWIPSHVGILGNELADKEAKHSLS